MAAALAALAKERRDLRIEKYHGFGCQCAALGGAERQHVNAAAPSDLGGRGIEADERIDETCAIHMHGERSHPRDLGQGGDFIGSINSARLSGLGYRERRWNHLVRTVSAITAQRCF